MARDDSTAALLARARAAVAEKTRQGVYSLDLRARLAEPLDLRPDPSFAAGPAWEEARRTTDVSPDPPVISTRPVVGALIRALKRLAARGLRWYFGPVAAQATAHNRAVMEVLDAHSREIVELRREVDRLRRRVVELEAEAAAGETRSG